MEPNEATAESFTGSHPPWNKGKLIGQKPPLQPKHVWAIRSRLQLANRKRDLALFNVAIDSKLRGCDVVSLGAADIAVRYLGVEVDDALAISEQVDVCKQGQSGHAPTYPCRQRCATSRSHAAYCRTQG